MDIAAKFPLFHLFRFLQDSLDRYYLVMHLSGQVFQLVSCVFQRFSFDVVVRSMSQQLVECDDVTRDL